MRLRHWYAFKPAFIPGRRPGEAEGLGGQLVSMETVEEWNWLRENMIEPQSDALFSAGGWGVCIGGIQNLESPEYSEPTGGWEWLTGVPFECNEDFSCVMENYLEAQHKMALVRNEGEAIQFNDIDEVPDQPYYMVEWSADCNEDGIVDYGQILDGTLLDTDGDGIPDVCDQPGGFDGILDVPGEYATIQDAIDAVPDSDLDHRAPSR